MNKPIKLVISNQRGGVAKTTTVLALGRYFADQGMKVLIIDTDPQGSIETVLGLKPTAYLYHFLIQNYRFEECLTKAHPNIDIICGSRQTTDAEHIILAQVFREFTFDKAFSEYEAHYDAILVDAAPSISLFQTCAMIFCKQVLIPVAMETLSLQGCSASINAASVLNAQFIGNGAVNVRTVGILPVMVNPRLQMTEIVMRTLRQLSERHQVPILPQIRQDAEIVKAAKSRKFLADHAPNSRAVIDYSETAKALLAILEQDRKDKDNQLAAPQEG